MQSGFSELEYAAKKKPTRRDRFLAEIDAVTPWVDLQRALTPFRMMVSKHAFPGGARRQARAPRCSS